MEPSNWRSWISTLRAAVQNGDVSTARIDDAVRRILLAKQRAGVFDEPLADRTLVNRGALGSAPHRAVAREAVRKSLVLLKNEGVLPIDTSSRVFVAGRNADNMGHQCGGWTISWQGGSGDITPGTTILEGIEATVARAGGSVTFSENGSGAAGHDVAIVVIGETPYAEGFGDDNDLALDPADLACLARIGDIPTVVVLVSGRPLIVTEHIDDWDALVAAWLPGTEGGGVADLLFGDHNFSGALPHSWPASIAQVPINIGDAVYEPLFPFGHALDYDSLPPSVTVAFPGDGSFLPAGDITLEATASDTDGAITSVAFFADDTFLGSDSEPPYRVTWTGAADGCYTIRARAFDDTALADTHAISVTVGSGCDGQAPFSGSPARLPGIVQAEDYDLGGQDVAYHDTSPGNNGGAYRSDDVDLESSTEQGANVGWMRPGEWLEYTVDIERAGRYRIDARVASQSSGGSFRLLFNNTPVGADFAFAATGGWQTWVTESVEADLPAGLSVMRFENLGGDSVEFNLNWFGFTRLAPDCPADLAEPSGVLDLADIVAFTAAFLATQPAADLDGNGVYDLADINAFVTAFNAGCP
jgi:hypothetical protein